MYNKRETMTHFITNIQKNWPEINSHFNPELVKIHRLQEYLQQDIANVLAQYKLQQADFSVLAALRRSGKPYCLTPTELIQSMLFSSGGLTKVLHRISTKGFIERLDNPQDRRSKWVQLTPAGKVLVEKIMPEIQQLEASHNALTPAEKQQLNELLNKMLLNWETPTRAE